MMLEPQRRESPRGHIALLAIFILATVAFLYDTLNQSHRLENVIVILPVSALVLVLCARQIYRICKAWPAKDEICATEVRSEIPTKNLAALSTSTRTAMFMALLGLYVLGLIYFYFDVSTFLFITLALWVQGEKRYVFGTIYALALSLLVIWGLKNMVPFPFETLIF